jgi:hypothetical protein
MLLKARAVLDAVAPAAPDRTRAVAASGRTATPA